ncbi:MAG: DNA-binding protein [Verrucomicrobiota bacterium]
MAVTKEKIFAIADELDANGQNPTLAQVRKQLGSGSFTTISEAMTEWKARKAAKEAPAPSESLPPAAAERLGELGAEIWCMALDLATGRLAAEREALAATRRELEAGKHEAAELANQVIAELEELQGKMVVLAAATQAAKDEADTLRTAVAGLTERVTMADARGSEIEKRAADLNAELARVNEQNATLIKTLTELAAKKKP